MSTQRYSLQPVTTDLADPVTIGEVQQYLRISDPDDNVWIRNAIRAARMLVEKHTHRQLMTKTWDLALDCFPAATDSLSIPRPPLQTIDSITYVPSSGGTTTIDSTSLHVDTGSEPGRVAPVFDWYWPTARLQNAAVTVQFTAGYGGDAVDVPEPLRQAIMMMAGHWYEHRETVVVGTITNELPMAFEALCGSYRFGDLH